MCFKTEVSSGFYQLEKNNGTSEQGLSQDFKTARPTQMTIPQRPVQPILGLGIHTASEPRSDPALLKTKEYNAVEAPCPLP